MVRQSRTGAPFFYFRLDRPQIWQIRRGIDEPIEFLKAYANEFASIEIGDNLCLLGLCRAVATHEAIQHVRKSRIMFLFKT
jgi:hypothetical protein